MPVYSSYEDGEEMSRCLDVTMSGCQDVSMSRCHDVVRISRCQDVRMSGCHGNSLQHFADAVPEYKKVASPAFSFRLNKFPKFSLSILTMPGTRNLPLGDLSIESNKVPCNCSLIRVREELQ